MQKMKLIIVKKIDSCKEGKTGRYLLWHKVLKDNEIRDNSCKIVNIPFEAVKYSVSMGMKPSR